MSIEVMWVLLSVLLGLTCIEQRIDCVYFFLIELLVLYSLSLSISPAYIPCKPKLSIKPAFLSFYSVSILASARYFLQSSTKAHQSAMHAFVEFECHFAQLSERDQGLAGANKFIMFVKSTHRNERKCIGVQLEDDDGANGLTEN